jgi:pimeloyl-ACP methyl ester carboxylesterase
MPFFNLKDGTRIFYKEEGKGTPPVALVHGWIINSWYWRNQVPFLSKSYRVITPDLKGHGASDKPQGRYSVREFAGELNQLLDKLLGTEKFVLAGHSMGGMIALTYATDPVLSKRLKGLILANTTYACEGNPGMKSLLDMMKKGLFGQGRAAREALLTTLFNAKFIREHKDIFQTDVDEVLKCPDHVMMSCLESWVDEYDLTDKLSQISLPVLIVTSDTDMTMDPKYSTYMKEHIKNSQLVMIKPGIGHHSLLEAPEEFNKALKGFIERL